MIRRIIGQECLLFTQVDHARLAGEFAKCFGNQAFPLSRPAQAVIRATAIHDDGWPGHDEAPTINSRGQPTDVFESQPATTFQIWAESSRLAAEADDYCGLLVSLHGFALSIFASMNSGHVNMDDPLVRFELNKFQHAQIELQEQLRRKLSLRTDLPRSAGLAPDSSDPREQQLIADLRILQAMDTLSLCLLCSPMPFDKIRLRRQADPQTVECAVRLVEDFHLAVRPWPFDRPQVRAVVPCRRLSRLTYPSDEALRTDYAAAKVETVEVCITEDRP